ncbi:hypothetical protein OH76DRAFT_1554393 [Lentinus brumalis]|uniref:Uncharacterized protein n=1 Tax=Lentinus brumalis TaxID=2498619 RepID=A0A371DIA1_9APHY|nr:hypothetical protein OH76DRAFT_1554393 [Polyporus brumalis]
MASPRPCLRTWHYGVRLGEREAVELARQVITKEPEGSEKLYGLPDLGSIDEHTPLDSPEEESPQQSKLDAVRDWAKVYVQEQTGLSVFNKIKAVAVSMPDNPCKRLHFIIFFATVTTNDGQELGMAHREIAKHMDSIERVREILPHDEGGWYRDFAEYAAENPWSPPKDTPSIGDNPTS